MNATHGMEPRVTIVMTARERHSLAEVAIESIVAGTRRPYRLIYVDVESPSWLREVFAARAAEWNLEVMRTDGPLWPQQARLLLVDTIQTEYTVFIDNDVEVEAGWLESLVACADATQAGIVGPLYLAGGGMRPSRIHMAGGRLNETQAAEGVRILEDTHVLANELPERVAEQLSRQPCDFVEYHCMLIRSDLLKAQLLDSDIRCVHEHIDTSLSARRLGYATYIEPAARVTYLANAEYTLDDLDFFRARWERAHADASIAAFCKKWNVIDDERSFEGVRRFVNDHVAEVDPIRPALRERPEHETAMAADELRQTRSLLLDQARERGYTRNELAVIANAYHVAHILVDGGYRPCGRPFVNHLVGTASVLVRYGFRAETVATGLLHSAYTHCPPNPAGPKAAANAVCATLGGVGSTLEARVRAYTLRDSDGATSLALSDFSTLSLVDAETAAVVAANDVDMYLSGEIRYTGRTDLIKPAVIGHIARVCDTLGVTGLYLTLRREQERAASVPPEFMTGIRSSYRIAQDRRSAVSMVSNARVVLPD